MKSKTILAVLLALPAAGATAAGNLVNVTVVDDHRGVTLREYVVGGESYVAGQPGHPYHLVLNNPTGVSALAVVSVDGVNVVTGQTAGYNGSGYVLPPYGQVRISGWRKSYSEVARFYFTSLGDSYAARTRRPDNVGVIGVAVFPAAAPTHPPVVAQSADDAAMSAQAESSAGITRAPSAPLGTGHGRREYDPARPGVFHRASPYPAEVVSIRYDSHANLVARGIIQYRPKPLPQPVPFPGGFVPDPR